jgi:hypothetical protein
LSGLRFFSIRLLDLKKHIMTRDTFETILDSFPPKPSRSRLEPYAELILELHRRGRTYREIARIISERCDVRTSRSTVNDFVRNRAKRKRNLERRAMPEPKTQTQSFALLPKTDLPHEIGVAMDDTKKRIVDLKRRPMIVETGSKLFQYDPSKPLDLSPKPKNGKK